MSKDSGFSDEGRKFCRGGMEGIPSLPDNGPGSERKENSPGVVSQPGSSGNKF